MRGFGIKAEWNFFTLSHGESACDGIDGTTKREVTKIFLQRPYIDQISTPKDMFGYCCENISEIVCV